MLRHSLVLAAVSALAGCGGPGDLSAASAGRPATEPSNDLRLMAMIDQEEDTLRIVNPYARPVRDANVWVNGKFVQHVDVIPARGSVVLRLGRFYDAGGNTPSGADAGQVRVQLSTGENLYSVQGPAYE